MIDEKLDKEIRDYIVGIDGKVISSRTNRVMLTKRGYYDYLLQRYSDNSTDYLSEIIYRIARGIDAVPKCPVCGKTITYTLSKKAYPNWCSPKCRNNDPSVLAKNKAGVSASLKRVYVDRKDEIQKKRAETLKERYGCDSSSGSPFAVKEFQDKAKDTIATRYADGKPFEKIARAKMQETQRKKSVALWKTRGMNIEYTNHDTIIIHNACEIHGDVELTIPEFNNRARMEGMEYSCLCLVCHPLVNNSSEESMMMEFLDSYGIEYEVNTRKIIPPLELDFYIPSKKIAIEMNGIYYHSKEYGKTEEYHKNKTELCEEKGIQLIHIWEDDWYSKRDIILSMLKVRLNCFDLKGIHAAECEVREVSYEDAIAFCDENHIQGCANSDYRYGLYYNNELVSIMTFSDRKDNVIEMNRFCNKVWRLVFDAKTKLFTFAKKKLKKDGIAAVEVYEQRDWFTFDDCEYDLMGFECVGCTLPNFFYGSTRAERIFGEEELMAVYGEEGTEDEIMKNHDFHKCYDSGNVKFRMEI